MRFLTSRGFSSTSNPATVAVPAEGGRKHVRTRIVVVFPAPLGPRKPTIWPFSTSNEMLSTASVRAYRLVRPSTLIILQCSRPDRRKSASFRCSWARRTACEQTDYRLKFYDTDGGEVLSNACFFKTIADLAV